jgi:hypothetical protein
MNPEENNRTEATEETTPESQFDTYNKGGWLRKEHKDMIGELVKRILDK